MKGTRIIALILAFLLMLFAISGCKTSPNNVPQTTDIPQPTDALYLSGMLLYGVSPSPYLPGDIKFESPNTATFLYKAFGANAVIPDITQGYDATGWSEIKSGDVITGTDCRNIAVVTVDKSNTVIRCAKFYYVPGINYANPNPDQYDDINFYSKENNKLEDPRAIALASTLLASPQTSFFGKAGGITQGFLTTYSQNVFPTQFRGRVHTGTDFYIGDGQPFYSPLDGKILYAGDDDYKMLIIYNEFYEVTTVILHAQDNTPAKNLLAAGGTVQKGQLLGYGGSAGNPPGTRALHIEVRLGMSGRYQSFSTDPQYARKTNYDPMILSDLFAVNSSIAKVEYVGLGNTMYNLQNNGIAAEQANWIYFRNTLDGGKLYKSRPDDTNMLSLTNDSVISINIWGDWLYYINETDKNNIYKIRTDGTENTLLLANGASSLLFVNNKLYFINQTDKGTIYSMDIDGKNLQKLNNKQAFQLFYYNNTLYYTVGSLNKLERIWALAPDGSSDKMIMNTRTDGVMIYNNKMYFRDFTQALQYISMPLTSVDEQANAEKQVVLDHVPTAVNVKDNFLVYTNNNDGDSLYRQNLVTNESLKLSDEVLCRNVNLINNWIYYEVQGNPVKLYRIRIDGTQKQVMSAGNYWNYVNPEGIVIPRTPPPTTEPTPTEVPDTHAPSETPPPEATATAATTAEPTPTEVPTNTTSHT